MLWIHSLLLVAPVVTAKDSERRLPDTRAPEKCSIALDDARLGDLERAHERGEVVRLSSFPLPGGRSVELVLRPVDSAVAGEAVVVNADGSRTPTAPRARCFQGHVEGGGTAFLGTAPGMLHGHLSLRGETFAVGSLPGASTASVTRREGGSATAEDWCRVGPGLEAASTQRSGGDDDEPPSRAGSVLNVADLFVEVDHRARSAFDSDQACVDYASIVMTAASEVYRRDLGTRLVVPDGYLRVWNTRPPWDPGGFTVPISIFRDWWVSNQNPDRAIPRSAVHLFTSPYSFNYYAYGWGTLCSPNAGYQMTGLRGTFVPPAPHTSSANHDVLLFAHELGHTFGSYHTHEYDPPIDCLNGSGPNEGTVMGYCYLDGFDTADVGLRFHQRVQELIVRRLRYELCLERVLVAPGDYDADGTLDARDVVAADAVLTQGFVSLPAQHALDMDGDGDLDMLDRDLLAAAVGAPGASVEPYNGLGLNPTCLASLGPPLLGRTWIAVVASPREGETTALVVYLRRTGGVVVPAGEVLATGTRLFSTHAGASGGRALHRLPIPFDPALIGRALFAQAATQGQDGITLCNGLALTPGLTE